MTIDWTFKGADIAIVVATLLGPVLAVQAQKWLERGREITQRRAWIFRTLMATRATNLSPTVTKFPVDPAALQAQTELRDLLLKWLKGEQPVTVKLDNSEKPPANC